jgi:hypothetical protein
MEKVHSAAHFSLSVVQRSQGQSAVAFAAYRNGSVMTDQRTGEVSNYRSKTAVLDSFIINYNGTSEELWNAAEKSETRSNARTARELKIALPHELSHAEQVQLVRGYALWMKDRYNVALEANFHESDDDKVFPNQRERKAQGDKFDPDDYPQNNRHAHLQYTTRAVAADGTFGAKTRVLDDQKTGPEETMAMRKEWEKRFNKAMEKKGVKKRFSAISYKKQAEAEGCPEAYLPKPVMREPLAARQTRLKEEAKAIETGSPPPPVHRLLKRKRTIESYNQAARSVWAYMRDAYTENTVETVWNSLVSGFTQEALLAARQAIEATQKAAQSLRDVVEHIHQVEPPAAPAPALDNTQRASQQAEKGRAAARAQSEPQSPSLREQLAAQAQRPKKPKQDTR